MFDSALTPFCCCASEPDASAEGDNDWPDLDTEGDDLIPDDPAVLQRQESKRAAREAAEQAERQERQREQDKRAQEIERIKAEADFKGTRQDAGAQRLAALRTIDESVITAFERAKKPSADDPERYVYGAGSWLCKGCLGEDRVAACFQYRLCCAN